MACVKYLSSIIEKELIPAVWKVLMTLLIKSVLNNNLQHPIRRVGIIPPENLDGKILFILYELP